MTIIDFRVGAKSEFPEITRFKFVVGILIGLFYAISFYSYLYIIRETFRILSVTEGYDLWILTSKESNFYNLIFAFLSVILGQSMCFTFWLDRPKRIFGKQCYQRRLIVNDQRVLNWYFLSWFSKLSVAFAVMFGITMQGAFHTISFYPDYNYIFILVLIVLFFQTWNTIILKYKRKSYKWILYSIVSVSVTAFGLSRIDLIDSDSINKVALQKNTQYKYHLELPSSASFKKRNAYYNIGDIYLVNSEDQGFGTKPIIVIDSKEFALTGLKDQIAFWKSKYGEREIRLLYCRLHIHKTIDMEFINALKKELSNAGINKIAYAVTPKDYEYDSRYDQGFSINWRLFNWDLPSINLKEILNDVKKFQNCIVVKQDESGNCIVNAEEVNNYRTSIKQLIMENQDYIIKYFINDAVSFEAYLDVLSTTKEVVHELRNKYSVRLYGKQFESLNSVDKKLVRKKYPLNIMEIPGEQASSF